MIGPSALSNQIMRDNNISLDPVTGSDGYLIRSVELDGKNYLLILGERAIAALYGVYEYFERFCDVGYFPEGDHIIHKEKLPLAKLDIVDRPRFDHRVQHLESRAVNLVQSSYYWTLDQYRHTIDWMVKNKFNMELPMNKLQQWRRWRHGGTHQKRTGRPRQGPGSESISGYVGFDGIISNRFC